MFKKERGSQGKGKAREAGEMQMVGEGEEAEEKQRKSKGR